MPEPRSKPQAWSSTTYEAATDRMVPSGFVYGQTMRNALGADEWERQRKMKEQAGRKVAA